MVKTIGKETKSKVIRVLMWFFSFAATFEFFKIMNGLEENGTSETKYLIGLLYFSWLAVMCK